VNRLVRAHLSNSLQEGISISVDAWPGNRPGTDTRSAIKTPDSIT
jgi:hypothetical protein